MRRLGPALLLAAYGGAFALAAFGPGLPVFDDHPGQFFRLWHALERTLPGGHGPADWNPDWWGGYPELQFYPPGFAMAGAAIRFLALGQLSIEAVYRLLCGVVLLLPALTTYWLLARTTGDAWLALPPAFLALTLSAGLRGGVEESVRWGMLTSRLALGGLPLLVLSLRGWVEAGRPPVWAPLAGAAVVLAHPAGGPAVLAAVGLAALLALALRPGRARLAETAVVLGLTAALTAFWLGPLLVRRTWLVPLTWGQLAPAAWLLDAAARPVLLAVAVAAPLAWVAVLRRRRPFEALLAALPLAMAALLGAGSWLFARGWSPLEPGRLVDGLAFSLLWAAGVGITALGAPRTRAAARARRAPTGRPVVALAAVVVAAGLSLADGRSRGGEPTLSLWPTGPGWPTLSQVTRQHDLGSLWAALRGHADRVLFLVSSLRLDGDPAWYAPHSHVLSLTPLLAGREIVHGTFTHPAPLAARFYLGLDGPNRRLGVLAEQLDGRLLGRPWDAVEPGAFDAFARRLRIATVVVPTGDVGRARFLAPAYAPAGQAAGFTLFERRQRPWPTVERITHRRYRVSLTPAQGVWVPTGIAAYPLWQVKSRQGVLETRPDPWGLLEFRVPLDVFEAELVYSEGWLEWLGLAVTLAGGLAWVAWAWTAGRRPASVRGRVGRPPSPRRPA